MNLLYLVGLVLLLIIIYKWKHQATGIGPGQAGTLQFFGGSNNSYIRFPSNGVADSHLFPNAFDSSASFTIEYWMKQDPTVGQDGSNGSPRTFALSGYDGSSGHQVLAMSIEGTEINRTLYVWIDESYVFSYSSFPVDQQWHHVALVGENGVKLSLYVDGTRVGYLPTANYSILDSGGITAKHFNIGSYPEDPNPNVTSYVGYLANFNYTLEALYSGTSFTVSTAQPTKTANTLLLLLAESDSTKFKDSSNFNFTAASYGSPAPTWSIQTLPT